MKMKMNGDANIAIEHSQLHLVAGFTRNHVSKPSKSLSHLVHAIDAAEQVIILQTVTHLDTRMGMNYRFVTALKFDPATHS